MGVYRALGPSSKVSAILGGSSTGIPAVVSVETSSDEFESMIHQAIYCSATPGDYELEKTGGVS